MKPPPRTRNKVDRNIQPEQPPRRSCPWTRAEQTKLRDALKRLSRTAGDSRELDYAVLGEAVPTRSVSQLRSVVDSLKNQVISRANLKLKRMKWEEKRTRKPIQEWTHLASAVAGKREEAIATAFSQMFIVSSTEPRTLRNCDPPRVHTPPSDKDQAAALRRPSRPALRSPSPAHPQVFRTPAPTRAPMVTMTASTVTPTKCTSPAAEAQVPVRPTTALQPSSKTVTPVTTQVTPIPNPAAASETQGVCTSGVPTTQKPSDQHPFIISTSTSPSPHTPSAACTPPTPGSALSSGPAGSIHPTPPLSTSPAEPHTSEHATKDTSKTCDVKTAVDFERIYRYLSVAHRPNEERHLTPMESAILLDLLMSLPEELELLDCSKLQNHLIQVYGCLTSHADSDGARTMCKDLKERLGFPTGATKGQDGRHSAALQGAAPQSAAPQSAAPQNAAGTQPDEAESQPSGIADLSSQSAEADVMGLWPPLNPFLLPLKLLKRKQVGGQSSKTNVHQF